MKLKIFGKSYSRPYNRLKKSFSYEEVNNALSENSEDALRLFYKGLNLLSRDNLIFVVWYGLTDKNIFHFASGLTNEEFDFNRYNRWLEFRKKHMCVANSPEYFKVKYGLTWENRMTIWKNRKANAYEVSHWVNKGLSIDEAEEKIRLIKYKTSMPKARFIELYGEEEGIKRWRHAKKFHANTLEYWGNEEDFKKYTRECNRNSKSHWIKRGYSEKEAITKVSEQQKLYSGLHLEYWKSKGLSDTDIEEIWNQISSKKDGSSLKSLVAKFGEEVGIQKYEKSCAVKSSTWRKFGKFAEELYTGIQAYRMKVARITCKNEKLLGLPPGKRGRTRGCYHVDHIFSVIEGFKNGVPPDVIGSIHNLRWILCEENASKRSRCDITLEDLMEKYYENQKN